MSWRDVGMLGTGLVVGACVGVGSYLAGNGSLAKPKANEDSGASAIASELRALHKKMATFEVRMAAQEQKPGVQEALNDPALRAQLAAAAASVKGPEDGSATTGAPTNTWRRNMVENYRKNCREVEWQLRTVLNVDEAAWRKVEAVLKEHTAPLEAYLKDWEQGKVNVPPRVNTLIAGKLPTTLAAIKLIVPESSYEAMEKWRHQPDEKPSWSFGKGELFLAADEYKQYAVHRSVAMYYGVLAPELAKFCDEQKFDGEKKKLMDAMLKRHLERVMQYMADKETNLRSPEGMAKARAITGAADAEAKIILGAAGLERFQQWRRSSGSRCMFFGEEPVAGGGRMPTRPSPRPKPVDTKTPPEHAGADVDGL